MSVHPHDPAAFKNPHPVFSSYTSIALSPTTKLLTFAGQVAEDPETGATPPDLGSQVDLCLARLATCLNDAGVKKSDLTRFMYYISQRGIDQVDDKEGSGAAVMLIGAKAAQWLEGHRPASCFLRVFGMTEDKFLSPAPKD
ncbi:hypothetical protein NQ176_g3101 [Zarea fungicola]|uniref:Uncharacterized protein n=1 Tax=Zarea fungicola TaxID=93591 RepID=A0ACC1NL97_9HYPO|nr:hypothetical protein NQ176_g3101 [Lecanicillium fungicola]